MQLKYLFACISITGTAIYAGYLAGTLNTPPENSNAVFENKYAKTIQSYKEEINKIKQKLPKGEEKYFANAIKNYGSGNLFALAMNGANECPSSELVSKYHKCHALEQAAIMYATINLTKLGENGASIYDVVYSRTGRHGKTPMFSWTAKKVPINSPNSKDVKNREIFQNSLNMAAHILGGGHKYQLANYGQFYFCNKSASPCKGHETNSNYVPMGRINLTPDEVRQPFIHDQHLSKHHFYTLTKKYLKRAGLS